MTRPITWAVGSFVGIALAASAAGEQLARLVPARAGQRPVAETAIRAGQPARTAAIVSDAGRSVTFVGDTRGHFQADVAIEGRRVSMLVDTGASIVALTAEDAAAAGIRPAPGDFTRSIATANGSVAVAPVLLREVRIGDIVVRDVAAVVVPRGRLGTSLLGMSFLRELRGFDVADNRLTLRG